MAFADPQSVTINAIPISLPRISAGNGTGSFQAVDGATKLSISNAYGKRTRRMLRLDVQKNAADPLNPTANLPYNMSCYVVVDVPLFGYTVAEQKLVVDGLVDYLDGSSGARVTQLLGGEN